jgi:hypothetical protein
LRAWATIQADGAELAALRQKPVVPSGRRLPVNFLKHSDEQTIAGLTAIFKAWREFGMLGEPFAEWGVVAAPRFVGRGAAAAALFRFARDGVHSASPFLVPHRSLHSVSATMSMALASHGPNFAVSGGPGNVAEGLLAALVIMETARLPGLWLVVSGWDPEPAPDDNGQTLVGAVCRAAALALQPAHADCGWPTLGCVLKPFVLGSGGFVHEPDLPALVAVVNSLEVPPAQIRMAA